MDIGNMNRSRATRFLIGSFTLLLYQCGGVFLPGILCKQDQQGSY